MPDASGARILRRITANWPLKLTALALAAVLWAAVAADEPSSQRVAIALRVNAPEGRPLTRSLPTVYGIFGGPARELLKSLREALHARHRVGAFHLACVDAARGSDFGLVAAPNFLERCGHFADRRFGARGLER